jgi:hypothetical protein
MDVDDSDGQSELPFPGEMVDGEQTVQYFNIKKTRAVLEQLCVGFGLSKVGNKGVLTARLRAFSSDRDAWKRAAPTTRRMHRGPKAGKITKQSSKKKSSLRADEIFKNGTATTNGGLAHLPARLPMQVAMTTPTQSENILSWAKTTSVEHPYMSKEGRLEAGRTRLRIAKERTLGSSHMSPICLTDAQVGQLATSLSNLANGEAPSRLLSDVSPQTPIPFRTINRPPHQPVLNSAPSATNASSTSNSKMKTRSITFADGSWLEFHADDVRPPPAISFADDLRLLNAMWDDTPGQWGGHSALNIKGVPVPIVYWKDVYARSKSGGWKPSQWKQVKGSWFEWKVIVKRWRQGSEDDFWREFSTASGKRLTYTAIVDRLAQARKENDSEIASRAKQEYGDEFSKVFCYKKNGACFVKVKASDIAKQYRMLKNITDDSADDMDTEN